MDVGRLERALADIGRHATDRRIRRVAQFLLAVGLGFLVVRLRAIWSGSNIDVGRIGWLWVAGAVACAAASVAAAALVWLAILTDLEVATKRLAGVFLQAQLAKYIPGSVWQYAGRATLARAYGAPVAGVARSLAIEVVAAVIGAGIFIELLLGWWALAAVVLMVVGSVTAAGVSTGKVVRASTHAVAGYGVVWLLMGVSFWMTARGLLDVPAAEMPRYTGAFACAWLAGFVAIYAPGGLGVREAVLVALLRGRLGTEDALVVAAASRVVFTIVDLGGAAVGTALLRHRRSTPDLEVVHNSRP
jgi:glycosyltransferase 2 family protein